MTLKPKKIIALLGVNKNKFRGTILLMAGLTYREKFWFLFFGGGYFTLQGTITYPTWPKGKSCSKVSAGRGYDLKWVFP